jgi:hypothetical protein
MSEYTVASHFEGKSSTVLSIYQTLLKALRQFGEVQEAPKKTSIHLDNATGFAGVYPRKDYILLHFRTAYPIEDKRLEKSEQLSAKRFKYSIRLQKEGDIDAGLLAWLKDAYELAGK